MYFLTAAEVKVFAKQDFLNIHAEQMPKGKYMIEVRN